MVSCSPAIQSYFDRLRAEVNSAYAIAQKARAQGLDPERTVPIPLAENMAERVEGLISSVAPQIIGSGITERIVELEKKHGSLSWKVALVIAHEVAEERFCSFETKREAIEVGIRTGFAYHTVGVVAAPLEGFVELKLKKRADGKEYFCLLFSGPIRGAGGTASAVSLLIADYIRKKLGYAPYDPQELEIKRMVTELYDYHDRVTNLQYKPSEAEIQHIATHLPIEVSGDPTEIIEVSNYKDLPRIETNRIRGGMCLVISMVALKAPKLWKQLSAWGDEFDLEQWNWMGDFLTIQKNAKAKTSTPTKDTEKPALSADTTFIADLVSGRPVLTHPMAYGGFRLRYGRSRTSGYSSASIHPATMGVLCDYIAVGTQLKTERPGKAASCTSCDTIEGPIVLLEDGTVTRLTSYEEAKSLDPNIKEVLYLGDILFNYGDFYDRAHPLVPVGITEEEWAMRLTQRSDEARGRIAEHIGELRLAELAAKPHTTVPTTDEAIAISREGLFMHPRYTPYWRGVDLHELPELIRYLASGTLTPQGRLRLEYDEHKRLLERAGIVHEVIQNTYVLVEEGTSRILHESFGESDVQTMSGSTHLERVNSISTIPYEDKAGTFIGARMGRPEKAKMRKMTGNPHCLFPVGEEGGRMRSFQAAIHTGVVTADFPEYVLEDGTHSVYPADEDGRALELSEEKHSRRSVDVKELFAQALARLGVVEFPDLIKGVRGTMNAKRIPEHIAKGILRAMHDVYVNKDGTIRYDMTELPLTHFKPCEIGTSVEKLRELGYTEDMSGNPLEDDDQVCELKPQDIVLGAAPDSPEDGADEAILKITRFVDDELEHFYKLKPYYGFTDKSDCVGVYVIGLAPHTSAGILGRVIGFSKTQSMLCHPLYHAAMRRDTDGDESCIILLMDGLLNFSREFLPDRRGSRTMDAPLVLTSILDPAEVDDMVHNLDIEHTYPIELYDAARRYAKPWDVTIDLLGKHLGTPRQYEGMGYTHETKDINAGVTCSAYKLLPSMQEKLYGQMEIARRVRAVDTDHVATLVIEKHLIRDIRGNLRKFSQQQFRCVACNEKFRRPPLTSSCTKCQGKVIFTISEGSVVKYLEPAKSLVQAYALSPYLTQSIELLDKRIVSVFGKDREQQTGLGSWF
ncbi:MAG: DNA polymerase II large subunit [Candidatus Woesearchaeota archaeon]